MFLSHRCLSPSLLFVAVLWHVDGGGVMIYQVSVLCKDTKAAQKRVGAEPHNGEKRSKRVQSPLARAAHHCGQNTSGCGPVNACRPDITCWRASSHTWSHDRRLVCPALNRRVLHAASSAPQAPMEATVHDAPVIGTRAPSCHSQNKRYETMFLVRIFYTMLVPPPCYHQRWYLPGSAKMYQ